MFLIWYSFQSSPYYSSGKHKWKAIRNQADQRELSHHPGALALLLDGVILEHPLHLSNHREQCQEHIKLNPQP
jgi:hypothetical protein